MKLADIAAVPTDEEGTAKMHIMLGDFFERNSEHLPFAPVLPLMCGSSQQDRVTGAYQRVGMARMWAASKTVSPYPGEPWGFDNGAWSAFAKAKKKGEDAEFPEEVFRERLENAYEIAEERNAFPHVAVVPDKVQGGYDKFENVNREVKSRFGGGEFNGQRWAGRDASQEPSLELSLSWIDDLQENYPEFPWFLALQPNFQLDEVEAVLHKFDGLFLGGNDQMKHAARRWAHLAYDQGVRFHYGRCGTLNKLRHAFSLARDFPPGHMSIDSAFPLFSKVRFGKFMTAYLQAYIRLVEYYRSGEGPR